MESRRPPELTRIEELVRDLAGGDDTPKGLIREHLEAARFYLLGAMPSEYRFNLEMVESLLSQLDDKELQSRLRDFLQSQRSTVAPRILRLA